MSEHDRELAEAILRELSSDVSAARAALAWADTKDMRRTLAHVAAVAIEAVLARRLCEAARTGPWEGGNPVPIKDVGPGFAAFLRHEMSCEESVCHWQWFAERQNEDGQDCDHYVWCRSCGSSYPWLDTYYLRRLFEAGEATRTGPWDTP